MSEDLTSLHKLFVHELKDVASAEAQLVKALPKMAKNANSEELREAFETHLAETQNQLKLVKGLLDSLGETEGEECVAMKGIIEEGEKLLKMHGDESVQDAALIAAAQKAEHYEIATYGTLRSWAELMGLDEAASVLDEILEEEAATDEKLTALAESINAEAPMSDGE